MNLRLLTWLVRQALEHVGAELRAERLRRVVTQRLREVEAKT